MKILLVGEFYSDNLGDPLLCQTVQKLILREYPDARIIPFDLTGRVSETEYYEPVTSSRMDRVTEWFYDRFLYYRRFAILRAYDKDKLRARRIWYRLKELRKHHRFDLVIFAGGSVFMDYFAGVINLILRQFAFSRTKILFHACGMSTLDEDAIYLLRQVLGLRNVVSISLRDSFDKFSALFPTKAKVVKTYDTALNCSRLWEASGEKKIPLGIGLIDRCYDQQLALIRYFLHRDIQWKAFTNGSSYDWEYAAKLLMDAGIPEEKIPQYLERRPVTVQELIDTVTGFERIIAFRMHCQIVAASYGVPSFGFAWDAKVAEFYEKLGWAQGATAGTEDFEEVERCLNAYDQQIHSRALEQGEESRKCLMDAIRAASGN